MADNRAKTSAENGKLGGRPVSEATICAQLARKYIAEQVKESLGPIVARAISLAMDGDKDARNWLSDQGWGKPPQVVEHSGEVAVIDEQARDKAIRAVQEILGTGDTE
jgi:predicted nucleic acid-binding Zn ribbon protein